MEWELTSCDAWNRFNERTNMMKFISVVRWELLIARCCWFAVMTLALNENWIETKHKHSTSLIWLQPYNVHTNIVNCCWNLKNMPNIIQCKARNHKGKEKLLSVWLNSEGNRRSPNFIQYDTVQQEWRKKHGDMNQVREAISSRNKICASYYFSPVLFWEIVSGAISIARLCLTYFDWLGLFGVVLVSNFVLIHFRRSFGPITTDHVAKLIYHL